MFTCGERPGASAAAGCPGRAGLVAAVEACVARARARHPRLHARLFLEGDWEGLPESLNLAVYRIVQESLTNCVRHFGQRHFGNKLSRARGTGRRCICM